MICRQESIRKDYATHSCNVVLIISILTIFYIITLIGSYLYLIQCHFFLIKFSCRYHSIYFTFVFTVLFISICFLSPGFKKKKMSSDDNKNKKCNHGNEGNEKKGTVFDFLNKIPSSSGAASSRSSVSVGKTLGSIKISTSSIHAQRKELKKITAKSAF